MPDLDERQVAKALKQKSPTTPVIMLMGWGAFMKEDGNLPEKLDGIISKPPRARELRKTLSRFHPAQPGAKKRKRVMKGSVLTLGSLPQS
ncbi:MAG: hypothetical protein WBS33_01445 [Verrucomicrobiia bacterium]